MQLMSSQFYAKTMVYGTFWWAYSWDSIPIMNCIHLPVAPTLRSFPRKVPLQLYR